MILRDVRGTMRLMRSQPALTAGIVLMLALGIGATTAIFSVVYGVLLKPLPFPEPDRIVQIWGSLPSRGLTTTSLTEANFWDMRDMNQSLAEFGALHGASFTLTVVNPALMAINADGGDITTLTITISGARKTYLPLIRR